MGEDNGLVKLREVCSKIGSGATPRGGKEVYVDSGISLIRSQNIYNDHFDYSGLAFITDKHAAELENVSVEPQDVLLNITGDSVARVQQVPASVLPARVNQHVSIIRPDPKKLDPKYLFYYLVSPFMQEYMLSLASSGGTRNALTKGMIENFEILHPPLPEQRRIAHILGTLDDKIELNRRMNATLEAIARALFKSWFVDFDPVRAKLEGRPSGLPAGIGAFLPDGFEDSELGKIPRGWEVKPLDNIADFLNGLALQKYPPINEFEYLPVIKIREMRQGYSSTTDKTSTEIDQEYIVEEGDFLFSWSGSLITKLWTEGRGALNQHLFKVTSIEYPKWFYYFWVQEHLPEFQAIAAGKATTMGHIQRHHINAAMCLVPPQELLNSMTNFIQPLLDLYINNDLQSRRLSEIRDELLPRLMRHQILQDGYDSNE